MDLKSSDWAIVIATFLGPLSAVLFTFWYQNRIEYRRARADVFAVMMRWRRQPTSIDFVGALNVVPVHFNRDQLVIAKYAELMAIYDDVQWSLQDVAVRARLIDAVNMKIAYLLSAMADAVGQKIEQLQILRGGYAPQGWADDEEILRGTRTALQEILLGKRFLPVVVVPPASGPEPESASEGSKPATPL